MVPHPLRPLADAAAYLWRGLRELLTRLALWWLARQQARYLAEAEPPDGAFHLKKVEVQPGSASIEAETLPEVIRVLALEMAKLLGDAPNYVQMEVRPKYQPFGVYWLTISRAKGEMPAAKAARLEREIAALKPRESSCPS